MSYAANAGKSIGMRSFPGKSERRRFRGENDIFRHMLVKDIRSISFADSVFPGGEISLELFNKLYGFSAKGKVNSDGDFYYCPQELLFNGKKFQITASYMHLSNYTQRYISIDLLK